MRGWPLVFGLAAAFNGVIALALLAKPAWLYRAARLGAAPLLEARALGWCIAVFGLFYGLVARHPWSRRDVVGVSLVGKLGFAVLVWLHVLSNQAPLLFGVLAGSDLAWVLVFVAFLWSARPAGAAPARGDRTP